MVIKLLKPRTLMLIIALVLLTTTYSFSQYCNSTGDASVVTGMTSVSFNTINNSTATNLAYTDYTGSQSTTVMQGSTYDLSVNLNTAGNWTIHSIVWIDWNQNNLFDDGSYDLGTATNVTDGTTTLSALSVTVPMGATLGVTRMRVSSKWDVDPAACGEVGMDGEVEDYAIVVTAFVVAPEINVQGNGVSIVNGDTTPATSDDTDFGSNSIGVSTSKTFTIQNIGSLDLTISNISLSNSTDFSITGAPYSTPVASSNSTTFQITFNSLEGGLKTSTVSILNNDSDEATYAFDISAEAICPIITLSGSSSTPETCAGCNDITITAGTPSGGIAPYEYSIDGVNWTSSNTFTNLSKEYFTVYTRDSIGCLGQERITNEISFSAGACVIDMGIIPQTVNNGLAPYGLIYDLVQNDNVPVYWIIDPDKSFVNASAIVNQKDLTVTGTTTRLGSTSITTDLKSGPFLIPAEHIADAYATIEAWQASKPGLTVHWNLDSISNAPVNGIISTLANVVIYPEGGDVNAITDIEDAFFLPAGIPTSAYRRGFISDLNDCDEIYVLSHHTDPDVNWSQQDVDDLYDYVIDGGNVWMGCHDVNISESLLTTSNGTQLNFLSEKGLIPYSDQSNISTNFPYLTNYADINNQILKHDKNFDTNEVSYNLASAASPFMQFMNNNHNAMDGNSEHVFLPFTEGWRATTTAAIYDPSHIDLAAGNNRSPGKAAIVAYGPAYGNSLYGTVLYQGSHINDQNNGSIAEYVGERRVFANYLLESAIKYAKDAGNDQAFTFTSCGIASTNLEASLPYNESGTWSIVSGIGGSFEDVNNPNTEFYGQENETYELKWSISCVEDTVNISFVTDCPTIDFDGEDDHISFNNEYELTSDFSVEVWLLSKETNSDTQTILSRRNGASLDAGYDLRLENNIISFNWNSNGTIVSPYAIGTDRWYHVAISYSNGTYTLYIDGVQVNSVSGVAPTSVSDNVNTILGAMDKNVGYQHIPYNYYKGSIDELRIWDVALTVDQIRAMMNQEITIDGSDIKGSTIPTKIDGISNTNLDGYYQMNQSSDVISGYMVPISGSTQGRIKNSRTYQDETAPIPYVTVRDGEWSDNSVNTPWAYCSTVWNTPNSIGIDGATKIDWNIVVINKHNVDVDQDVKLLGLISLSDALITDEEITDSELTIGANGGSHKLNISNYLKLDGKIDLENESQLIQGDGSLLAVDSKGYIERDQQGTENSYTYNYWSSPVSLRNNTANNVAFSVADVLRDGSDVAPKAINFAYNYAHADGELTDPRKIATYWIWKFVNLSNEYANWEWVGSSNNLNVTEGYTMKGTSGSSQIMDDQNYTFRGKPNNGDLIHTTFPGTFDSSNEAFITLTGNPYLSALDADAFIDDNINTGTNSITGTLYFWEHWSNNTHYVGDYQGGYAIYTKAGGTKSTSHPDVDQGGVGNKPAPGQFIPVGQGFFVTQAHDDDGNGNLTNPSSGDVLFKNSQRVFEIENGNAESVFTRNASSSSNSSESTENLKERIWLGFESSTGYYRQLLTAFLDGATDSIDMGYDGQMIDQLPTDAYFIQDETPFSITAFGEFNVDREIPIAVIIDAAEGGMTQKIMIDSLSNISSDKQVLLKDNLTNTYHDLRAGAFEFNLDAGEYNNRFSLVFKEGQVLDVNNEVLPVKGIKIFMNNPTSEVVIKNTESTMINKTILYNILGQTMNTWTHKNIQQEISLPINNLSTGVYIVQVETENGNLSQKIVVE